MRKNYRIKKIFCFEGVFGKGGLEKMSTARPSPELLRMNYIIDCIYRDCATKEELELYLGKWTQMKYEAYPIRCA